MSNFIFFILLDVVWTLAFQSDITPEHIQLIGGWKTDAYKSYLVLAWEDKLNNLSRMYNFSDYYFF